MAAMFNAAAFDVIPTVLTDKQQELVKSWNVHDIWHKFSDEAMQGNYRIEIPCTNAAPKPAPKKLKNFLIQHGYDNIDYLSGVATDKYTRKVKIGKILNKLNAQELLYKFENDTKRACKNDYKIIVSRHPFDIAAMSTNRGWTSCMNFDSEVLKNRDGLIANDIKFGTHVAYLVPVGDDDIKHPAARILLRPFESIVDPLRQVIYPEIIYGSATPKFYADVFNWAEQNFPLRFDIYRRVPFMYNDSTIKIIANHYVINTALRDDNSVVTNLLNPQKPQTANAYSIHTHTLQRCLATIKDKKLFNMLFYNLHINDIKLELLKEALRLGLSPTNKYRAMSTFAKYRDRVVLHYRKKQPDFMKWENPTYKELTLLTNAELEQLRLR